MRNQGAVVIKVDGIELQFAGPIQTEPEEYEADDENTVDGVPLPSGPVAEAWLAQRAKQDQDDAPKRKQPDLMEWYQERPLITME